MRRGHDNEFLFTSDLNTTERDPKKRKKYGTFLGVNLGADFCSKHEWGIQEIDTFFKRDKITHKIGNSCGEAKIGRYGCVEGVIFAVSKDEEVAVLLYDDYCSKKFFEKLKEPMTAKQLKDHVKNRFRELYLSKNWDDQASSETLATAWDSKSFGIMVERQDKNGLQIEWLRQIYEAFKTGDIAIWLGGGGVFQNAGPCIAIYSHLPQEVIKKWKDHYEDMQKLKEEAEATGIEKKLREAGKKWFALSPKWAKDFKDVKSVYSVIFWLNPMEQDRNDYGWMTVEDLEDWIQNKGKIPKAKR